MDRQEIYVKWPMDEFPKKSLKWNMLSIFFNTGLGPMATITGYTLYSVYYTRKAIWGVARQPVWIYINPDERFEKTHDETSWLDTCTHGNYYWIHTQGNLGTGQSGKWVYKCPTNATSVNMNQSRWKIWENTWWNIVTGYTQGYLGRGNRANGSTSKILIMIHRIHQHSSVQ